MPNNKEDCLHKKTIDDQATEAKGHIDKVLADPALLPSLKNELNLAKENLRVIMADHHHL